MRWIVVLVAITTLATSAPQARAADNGYGKVFIKAGLSDVGGQQLQDPDLDDTVKDLKKRHGKFQLVEVESDADFLITVVQRNAVVVAGQPASKVVVATLSLRDGTAWKPTAKLQSKARNTMWSIAADNIISQAEDWVKKNGR